jgi:UDP-glucose 4-epimerase
MMRLIVTGATGFIGQRYAAHAAAQGNTTYPHSVRDSPAFPTTEETPDGVLYLSGLAHQMQRVDPHLYFLHNCERVIEFAKSAKENGVKHFLFVSTSKVYGDHPEQTRFDLNSPTNPTDAYGESKLKAESLLCEMSSDRFLVSIIRPPLVYGPGVKGNFLRFLRLGNSGWPLPFAGSKNRRSLVFVDNLLALIDHIFEKEQEGVFLAGERTPPTLETLMRTIRSSLGRPDRLFNPGPLPISVLRRLRPDLASRLFGEYLVDTRASDEKLNFEAPFSLNDGMAVTADWYLSKVVNG